MSNGRERRLRVKEGSLLKGKRMRGDCCRRSFNNSCCCLALWGSGVALNECLHFLCCLKWVWRAGSFSSTPKGNIAAVQSMAVQLQEARLGTLQERGEKRRGSQEREGEKEREAATNNEAMEELLRMRSRTRSAVPFTLGADIMEHCPFFLQPPLHFTSANNGRNDLETKRIGCSLHVYTVHAMQPILRSSLEVLILRQKSM